MASHCVEETRLRGCRLSDSYGSSALHHLRSCELTVLSGQVFEGVVSWHVRPYDNVRRAGSSHSRDGCEGSSAITGMDSIRGKSTQGQSGCAIKEVFSLVLS